MKSFIKKHFGTLKACSEELGVTQVTVQNWIKKNPRGILRFSPEIIADKDTTFLQLAGDVLHREHEIKVLEPMKTT